MNTLFPQLSFPPGFRYEPGFITASEEQAIMKIISGIELRPLYFQGYEAKRKVAGFGYNWSFEKRQLSRGKEIPKAFEPLIKKLAVHLALPETIFAELLVTEYPAGSVINWHRDAPPFGLIAGISLMADCIFRLRPYDKIRQSRRSVLAFPVQRRSLYVMEGEARTDWEHSTAPVANVRYSITLRSLKEKQ